MGNRPKMLLVHPPVAKPCEPPGGIAKLFSALLRRQVPCRILDANYEGLLGLLHGHQGSLSSSSDTWTRRAVHNLSPNLTSLKSRPTYNHLARYKRAVLDLNRVLEKSAVSRDIHLSLTNYQHSGLSPARSMDLIRSAERPEESPFYSYLQTRLWQVLEESQPSVVGFSLNFLSQALSTFTMVGFLRRHCPGLTLILGGGLVTSWLSRPNWSNPFRGLVDFLVAGPGEGPLLSILRIQKEGPEVHCRPDYGSLPLEDYLSPGFILPYSSASGCYWNRCLFCPERAEGNLHVPVPDDQVILDLRTLAEKTKPVLIHLLDNAIRPVLMKKITDNPPGVPWYGFARFTPHLTDLDFCLALKRSGCVMLQLGLESGDQGVLDWMQKGIDLGMASAALKTLKKAGIATYVYLLFGTPAETATEAWKTLAFTAKHSEQIGFLNLALFNLPVYAPEAQNLKTSNFYEGDLSLYTSFSHPKGWNRNLVRQFLDKEFRRHPAIAPILRRDPPFFTSNHAPFFAGEI